MNIVFVLIFIVGRSAVSIITKYRNLNFLCFSKFRCSSKWFAGDLFASVKTFFGVFFYSNYFQLLLHKYKLMSNLAKWFQFTIGIHRLDQIACTLPCTRSKRFRGIHVCDLWFFFFSLHCFSFRNECKRNKFFDFFF